VASALELGDHGAADPHVERLLESFAFLTGRIQRQLDNAIPEVPSALLDVLYPQLTRQLPSMAVGEFEVDPGKGDLSEGYRLDRHTSIFLRNEQGEECQFRTAYHLDLWPLRIEAVSHQSAADFQGFDDDPEITSVVRVSIGAMGAETKLEALPIDRLRFHLAGEPAVAFRLLETLLLHTRRLAVREESGRQVRLHDGAIRLIGLDHEDALLPTPAQSHDGYRLLVEYFAFPQKHLFVDVTGLSGKMTGQTIDLLFGIDAGAGDMFKLGPANLKLHCVPLINLFERTSEPIRLDETHFEYRLIPDVRSLTSTEIYSIDSISCSSDREDQAANIAPFYSCDHTNALNQPSCYWLARRDSALDNRIGGTDMFLSFVDLNLDLDLPPTRSVFASTLCTNRHAAGRIASGSFGEIESDAPLANVRCLHKPTAQIDPPSGGQSLWRLISHLSLNHLSLETGNAGLQSLKEILRLYAFIDPSSVDQQLAGLRKLESRQACRRVGSQVWRGFCFGSEIDLTIDAKCFVGSSALVLGFVLDRFLALFTTCNSFTQLSFRRVDRQGIWHAWPPRSGDQALV
ncbi:MAG: type VI secretion system baseplate subunit TssF, partial [Pseudomonadota bacterium]